ncbi:NUDIX domain-containing protein [Hydrogenophaga sp.]|jgi:ADP-ribose pyrophosphatase|uniref:NUDIX domain-containing protein n=1 Tax=Hydrogenophaga sp. TaxID=1904254 RepID=UPI0027172C8B|nr:NUDIX hydrolase [Hydrogenophaga sp.]MDO9438163.1 NUDIX hydrolase [Hydrogenophaga sp.]
MAPVDQSAHLSDPAGSHLLEEKTGSQELLRGHFLHAFRDTVRLPDGRETSREYVRHPGAVMIIAQLDDGRLVLERQYRYPVQAVMLEFPAGKLDAGESSLACAQRELREETGYSARRWARAGVLHPVISYSTEFIDIWFAKDLTAGQRQLDAGEFLDVFTASPAELLLWCRDGRVTDGKTLAGALWLQNVLSGAWVLDWEAGTC